MDWKGSAKIYKAAYYRLKEHNDGVEAEVRWLRWVCLFAGCGALFLTVALLTQFTHPG